RGSRGRSRWKGRLHGDVRGSANPSPRTSEADRDVGDLKVLAERYDVCLVEARGALGRFDGPGRGSGTCPPVPEAFGPHPCAWVVELDVQLGDREPPFPNPVLSGRDELGSDTQTSELLDGGHLPERAPARSSGVVDPDLGDGIAVRRPDHQILDLARPDSI